MEYIPNQPIHFGQLSNTNWEEIGLLYLFFKHIYLKYLNLGKIISFDVLINNWDRFPLIWNNDGNFENLLFTNNNEIRGLFPIFSFYFPFLKLFGYSN